MGAEREDQPSRPHAQPAPGDPAEERYGPLMLARYVKEDGRALILYGEEPPPDEDGA